MQVFGEARQRPLCVCVLVIKGKQQPCKVYLQSALHMAGCHKCGQP